MNMFTLLQSEVQSAAKAATDATVKTVGPAVGTPALWAIFVTGVVILLAVDQIVFHRKAHEVKFKEAAAWSTFWIALAAAFNIGLYFLVKQTAVGLEAEVIEQLPGGGHEHVKTILDEAGAQKHAAKTALDFMLAYILELALSVDNLFVFIIIFGFFKVPPLLHHRVLFWGVLGAQIMRAGFILGGAALVKQFDWMPYLLGAILLYSAYKLLFAGDEEFKPDKNLAYRGFKKLVPMVEGYDSGTFFVRKDGKLYATTLMLVLVIVEFTDVVFAVDSVPVVLAITTDEFVAFTSNIFAILGLRSMYFVLARIMSLFHYLKTGLALILAFVAFKMLMPLGWKIGQYFGWVAADSHAVHISPWISLSVIGTLLAGSIFASLLFPKKKHEAGNDQPQTSGQAADNVPTTTPGHDEQD